MEKIVPEVVALNKDNSAFQKGMNLFCEKIWWEPRLKKVLLKDLPLSWRVLPSWYHFVVFLIVDPINPCGIESNRQLTKKSILRALHLIRAELCECEKDLAYFSGYPEGDFIIAGEAIKKPELGKERLVQIKLEILQTMLAAMNSP